MKENKYWIYTPIFHWTMILGGRAPGRTPCQKETHLPIPVLQVPTVSLQEGIHPLAFVPGPSHPGRNTWLQHQVAEALVVMTMLLGSATRKLPHRVGYQRSPIRASATTTTTTTGKQQKAAPTWASPRKCFSCSCSCHHQLWDQWYQPKIAKNIHQNTVLCTQP